VVLRGVGLDVGADGHDRRVLGGQVALQPEALVHDGLGVQERVLGALVACAAKDVLAEP